MKIHPRPIVKLLSMYCYAIAMGAMLAILFNDQREGVVAAFFLAGICLSCLPGGRI